MKKEIVLKVYDYASDLESSGPCGQDKFAIATSGIDLFELWVDRKKMEKIFGELFVGDRIVLKVARVIRKRRKA